MMLTEKMAADFAAQYDEVSAIPVTMYGVDLEQENPDGWLAVRGGDFTQLKKDEMSPAFETWRQSIAPSGTKDNRWATVTASECGSVFGHSFKSNIELFDRKSGKEEKAAEKLPTDLFQMGHDREDMVLMIAEKELSKLYEKVWVWKDKRVFVSKKHPHMLSDTDGHAVVYDGENYYFILIECKTISAMATEKITNWNEGIVPEGYIDQCRHEMAVLGASRTMLIGCWGIGIRGQGFNFIFIDRDEDKEAALVKGEDRFIASLSSGVRPDDIEPDKTSLWYQRLYLTAEKKTVNLVSSLLPELERYENLLEEKKKAEAKVKELETEIAAVTDEIVPFLDDASNGEIVIDENTKYVFHASRRKKPVNYDWEGLEKDHPDLFQKYVSVKDYVMKKISNADDGKIIAGYKKPDEFYPKASYSLKRKELKND